MNAIDSLFLRWQFEAFTAEYQDTCWLQMVQEFAKAWHYKRNRFFVKKTLDRFQAARPDLDIALVAKQYMPDFGMPAKWWEKYAPVEKPLPYIGPEAYLQM